MIDDEWDRKEERYQLSLAFFKCIKRNIRIIQFAELLIENYNNNNETLYNNIIRNTTFNTNKLIDEDVDVNHLINYFNSFHFIKYKEIKTVTAHNGAINDMITLKDGRFATCSDDRTIKVFDPKKNFNCDIIILSAPENPDGHLYRIKEITELDNGNLVSISCDGTMKIWSINKNSYKCLHTIDDANEYSIVGLADNKLVSTNGLDEVIIRVLNEPYKDIPMKSISFSFGDYVYIRKKNAMIFPGDRWLCILSMETYQVILYIKVNNYYYRFNNQLDNELVCLSKENIIIIDVDTWIIKKEIKIETNCALRISNNALLIGMEQNFGIVNLNTQECTKVYTSHSEKIRGFVKIDESTFISTSSTDGKFKVWKY